MPHVNSNFSGANGLVIADAQRAIEAQVFGPRRLRPFDPQAGTNITITPNALGVIIASAGGADSNAVHVNAANEISTVTEKTSLAADDLFIIEDSAAAGVKKKVKQSNLGGAATDTNAVHVNVANEISGVTEKTTLANDDLFIIEDSEAAGVKKKVKKSNLPSGGSGNITSTGAEGSEPGGPATGDLYLPNNGFFVRRYSGSVWSPWGPIFPMTEPPTSLTGASTTLNNGGTMAIGDVSCTVTDGSVLGTAPFIIRIGTEDIKVGARSTNSLTSLTRGYNGTSAASHVDGSTVTLVNFEWVNQASATLSTTNGGLTITNPGGGNTPNCAILKRLAPSTPYTITAYLLTNNIGKNYLGQGVIMRQSSDGKFMSLSLGHNTNPIIQSDKFTSATVFSAAYLSYPYTTTIFPWLRFADNGTNRIASVSRDGINFIQIHSVGRTDFATADEIGWYVISQNAGTPNLDNSATLLSWAIT